MENQIKEYVCRWFYENPDRTEYRCNGAEMARCLGFSENRQNVSALNKLIWGWDIGIAEKLNSTERVVFIFKRDKWAA